VEEARKQLDCCTASYLVTQALSQHGHVDFCFVTDLCERIDRMPTELPDIAKMLMEGLDITTDARKTLKSLTILQELSNWDTRSITAFRAVGGLLCTLNSLQLAKNTGLGDQADANIRMLATEVEKQCFGNPSTASTAQRAKIPTPATNYPAGSIVVAARELVAYEGESSDSAKVMNVAAHALCRVLAQSRTLSSPWFLVQWEEGIGWVNGWDASLGPLLHQKWDCSHYMRLLREPLRPSTSTFSF